jgi:hypothetical protein
VALRIKELLYDEQYTIAGAKKKLASELRTPGRENLSSTQAKTPMRSLKPPPSLAAKFASPQPTLASTTTNEQPASLKQLAAELQEVLELLNKGDVELEKLRGKAK